MPTPFGLVSMKRTLSPTPTAGRRKWSIASRKSDVDAHIAAHYLDAYPGTSYLHVAQISDEPWMDGDVVQPRRHVACPQADLQFRPGLPRRALAGHDSPAELPCRHDAPAGGEVQRAVPHAARPGLCSPTAAYTPTQNPDGSPYTGPPITPPPPPPNSNNRLLIPLRDFVIEWDRVQDIGALDFGPLDRKRQPARLSSAARAKRCSWKASA